MKMAFTVGPNQKPVVLRRSWFTGKFVCEADGTQIVINSPSDLSTHINLEFKRTFVVSLGSEPKTELLIEHERPRLFGGLRPHSYRVSVAGETVCQYHGY